MGIESWSTTAANNNSAAPNGFPEGMAPSAVNDAARQVMASVRSWYEGAEWINLGYTHTYASGTSVTVAGSDVTAQYPAGRRVRAVGSSTGTIYGVVSSSSFSTDTTINFTWDSGSLSNESLTISAGIIKNGSTGQSFVLRDLAVTNAKLAQAYIHDLTAVTLASTDNIPCADASDSNNKKKFPASDILTLVAAGTWFKVVSTTRDISTASGNQDITGFGFDPKLVIIFAVVNGTAQASWGMSDFTTNGCIEDLHGSVADTWGNRAAVASLVVSAGNLATATASSVSDGVRLAWTKTGSPTGTAQLYVAGFR